MKQYRIVVIPSTGATESVVRADLERKCNLYLNELSEVINERETEVSVISMTQLYYLVSVIHTMVSSFLVCGHDAYLDEIYERYKQHPGT